MSERATHSSDTTARHIKPEPAKKSVGNGVTVAPELNPLWSSLAGGAGDRVQAKLTLGAVDDPLEREADQVASQVMAKAVGSPPLDDDEQAAPLQRKVVDSSRAVAPVNLHNTISSASSASAAGSGKPMAAAVRQRIEPVLGANLDNVRVHSDQHAAAAAAALSAHAFTHRNHIYLAAGQSSHNLSLMAHEAAHTVQQGAVIRRWPAVTPTTAETAETPATIRALSLSNFISLTERQLDWATSAAIQADAAALANFRAIQGFATTDVVRACGAFSVGDLIAKGVPAVFTPLQTYTRGVTTATTAWLRRTNVLNDAESWGRDLGALEASWPAANLSLVMRAPSPRTQKSPFEKLVDPARPELTNFILYLTSCAPAPVLSADNGSEVDSFLALRGEGAMPHSYNASIHYVTTYHHFTKATLDGLQTNEAFPAWRQNWALTQRPLTVVLYPAVDHNGAFHRNLGLESMVTNGGILTIVIEGHATVADYQSQLAPVAARYGIGGEIQQAMLAGHGNTTVLELAGTAAAGINADSLGTSGATGTNTTNLMTELTRLMSSSPANRRIVLDACLTDSHQVATAMRAAPADAAADVQAAVAANPSLRDVVAGLAGAGATVLGANASFAPAQTTFLTPGTTDITLQVPGDPDLVASKLQYVEFGTEPEGCMRAVLECWADDQITGSSNCRDAMRRRIAAGGSTHVAAAARSSWREGIIQPIYDLTANHYWGDGNAIRLLGYLAGSVFELYWDNHTSAATLLTRLGVISATPAHVNQLLTSVSGDARYAAVPRVALVIEQAWMTINNARRANFMTALGRYGSALDAAAHADMGIIMAELPHLLTLPPPSPPPAEQLRLALLAANHAPLPSPAPAITPRHIDFLQQLLGAGPLFPAALAIDAALGGLAGESEILTAIGRPLTGSSRGGGVTPPPRANIDLDRDPTSLNDFFVNPLQARGEVDTHSSDLMVRSRPSTASVSTIFARLPKGTQVQIIGEFRNWYAIEQPGRTGFVYKNYIRVLP